MSYILMFEFIAKFWKEIVATLALMISACSLLLSFKTRRDGNILKLVPKFATHFERADRNKHWDSFNNKHGLEGYTLDFELHVRNPSPYTLEIVELSSVNYLLVYSFNDFEPQPGYRVIKPARGKVGRTYEIKPESERRLSFKAFIESTQFLKGEVKFPDIQLAVQILWHGEKPKRTTYRVRRPVTPGIIVTEKR